METEEHLGSLEQPPGGGEEARKELTEHHGGLATGSVNF